MDSCIRAAAVWPGLLFAALVVSHTSWMMRSYRIGIRKALGVLAGLRRPKQKWWESGLQILAFFPPFGLFAYQVHACRGG